MRSLRSAVVCLILCFASRVLAADADFDVQFNSCSEYVGIGYVPFANARALVPNHYAVATGAGGNAFIVVRVTNCNIVAIAGASPQSARTAQVGIMLAGEDPSADINNYLLWFLTDSSQLTSKLQAMGIEPGAVQVLNLVFTPVQGSGPLAVNVTAPGSASYTVIGSASAPTGQPGAFVANWFSDGAHGSVRMHTEFHAIRFGAASTLLTPTPGSVLAPLVGSPTLTFAVLDSYNTWNAAKMQARLQ